MAGRAHVRYLVRKRGMPGAGGSFGDSAVASTVGGTLIQGLETLGHTARSPGSTLLKRTARAHTNTHTQDHVSAHGHAGEHR